MNEAVISTGEWQAASELVAPFAYDDEHLGSGYVHLVASDGRAVWSARGGTRFARLTTTGSAGNVDALLAPRTITAASALSQAGGPLTIRTGPAGRVSVIDGTISYHLNLPALQPPNVDELLRECEGQQSVTTVVALGALRHVVSTATRVAQCNQRREKEYPTLWLDLEAGHLQLQVEWAGIGPAFYQLDAAGDGHARIAIDPADLREFCNALDTDEVRLDVPTDEGGMLVIHAGTWTGGTVAHRSSAESYRPQIEQTLGAVFPGWSLRRDPDGDYVLPRSSTPSYARLADGPPRLQIFAVALHNIEAGPELLSELNIINAQISLARVFTVGAQVLVEGEILADTIDPATVAAVHQSVDRIASETAPLLAAMFGGTAGPDAPLGREWTWQRYLETVISVETTPGDWTDLNGPHGADHLPLPEPIHILTASNPCGQNADQDDNLTANARLAGELWNAGLTMARAVGRSPDGAHSEASVAVSGLTRQQAREVGQQYGQEAIYEITADTVLLISCNTDRTASTSRIPPNSSGHNGGAGPF